MGQLLPLTEALSAAAQTCSPDAVLSRSEEFLQRASELSGISIEELRAMNIDGSLDKFMSERFYFLSLVAIGATLEAIEAGQMPAEALPRIAMDASKLAQRLAGRDVQKKFIINADIWEHAASEVQDPDWRPSDD